MKKGIIFSVSVHSYWSTSVNVHTVYNMNFPLFQAIELASEVLANVKFIQEKKLIGDFINHITCKF